jgi:dipeptidyl aminopeptidase/acylaminoacyl peptidase
MFGSIWQVDAAGGEARQLTTSERYHAHPVWSPRGDKIAFVKGLSPRGRLPNVGGTLALVDIATGAESEVKTPFPVAGTLAWSPDASRLVCALRTAEAPLLYEIRVADGTATHLQAMPQGFRAMSAWIDVAWNPSREEVFFTAQRGGVPQVWSVRPGGPPIAVQLPLTRYRPEDIADLQGITALPDGSGVILSADLTNQRGNYELYRVSRGGGRAPEAITHTERDEFSPAVSPDGRRIAFVSNELGNMDLFTTRTDGSERHHVQLTALRFAKPSGRLRVRVTDELGKPTAVRLYRSFAANAPLDQLDAAGLADRREPLPRQLQWRLLPAPAAIVAVASGGGSELGEHDRGQLRRRVCARQGILHWLGIPALHRTLHTLLGPGVPQ